MKIRAEYYLIGGTVHNAVNGVILCSLGSEHPEFVNCTECQHQRFERVSRDQWRSALKCYECNKRLLELKRTSDFLEALPTTTEVNN